MSDDAEALRSLPREPLTPLAATAERVLAAYGYEVPAAIDAVDDAVPGFGGLFDPRTTAAELSDAFTRVLDARAEAPYRPSAPELDEDAMRLYVDGSSRGNPGPAGAGAVITDATEETLVRLGRPVGSNTGNNTAEYAALHLGVDQLLARYEPTRLDVRIDSMTVIRAVWRHESETTAFDEYRETIGDLLRHVPIHDWTHLADSDPNPADALATVGADIAALGP